MDIDQKLRAVKLAHTLIWALFAGCIVAIPIYAALDRFDVVTVLVGVVLVEVLTLAVNRWSCPLTGIAARYTDQRQDNFDIYLPLWLARNNKPIFGSLFVLGLIYAIWRHWAIAYS